MEKKILEGPGDTPHILNFLSSGAEQRGGSERPSGLSRTFQVGSQWAVGAP